MSELENKKHDFMVGWVTFIPDELLALEEAASKWNKIFARQTPRYRADNEDRRLIVAQLLKDATTYISANIKLPNPSNKYLPSKRVQEFPPNESTVGRLNAALACLNKTFDTLPWEVRREMDRSRAEVREAIAALRVHVNWVIDYTDSHKS